MTVQEPARSLNEPNIAIDPRNSMHLALGVNTATIVPVDALDHLDTDVSAIRADVLLSSDGGSSWRSTRPPTPFSDQARLGSADTDVVFDLDGTLHVTALVSLLTSNGDDTSFVYHTASNDDGGTWTEPYVFLQTGRDNRNWNTINDDNTLVVVWSDESSASTAVAWTADDGASWHQFLIEGCAYPAPAMFNLVACWREGIEIHHLDLVGLGAELYAALPADGPPHAMTHGPGDRVWLSAYTENGAEFWRSSDHGKTWELSGDLEGVEGAPEMRLSIRAFAADPWGNAHVLFTTTQGPCQQDALPGLVRDACPLESAFGSGVYYTSFADTGIAIGAVRLTPAEGRSPPTLAPSSFDEYHSIVFTEDYGIMAWTFEDGIDLTRIEREQGAVDRG